MGGLISGIYGLAAGDPTKPEEDQLGALSGYETGVGEGDTTAASKYYQDILSDDPTKIGQSLAPEIAAGQTQGQQEKNQLAQFGTRSGGTAAASAGIDATNRGNIINLVGGLQQGAAGGAASLGTANLGMASNNINADAGLKQARRKDVMGDVSGIANGAAEIAADAVTGGATGSVGNLLSAATPYEGTSETTPFTSEMFDSMQAGTSEDITPFF